MSNKSYKMTFICSNCGTSYSRDVPFGESSKGKGGKCPYCGTEDHPLNPFKCYKPGLNPYKKS